MKKKTKGGPALLIVCCALCLFACATSADSENSDPLAFLPEISDEGVPDSLKILYKFDAENLALDYQHRIEPGRLDLDASAIDFFYDALIHVYKSKSAQRDSVVEKHNIHMFRAEWIRVVTVVVPYGLDWAEPWANNVLLTGNETVNAYIKRFDMSIQGINDIWLRYASLYANRPINPVALSEELAKIEGVEWTQAGASPEHEDFMKAAVINKEVFLTYRDGIGNCPGTCDYWTNWKFKVDQSGRVEFLERFID